MYLTSRGFHGLDHSVVEGEMGRGRDRARGRGRFTNAAQESKGTDINGAPPVHGAFRGGNRSQDPPVVFNEGRGGVVRGRWNGNRGRGNMLPMGEQFDGRGVGQPNIAPLNAGRGRGNYQFTAAVTNSNGMCENQSHENNVMAGAVNFINQRGRGRGGRKPTYRSHDQVSDLYNPEIARFHDGIVTKRPAVHVPTVAEPTHDRNQAWNSGTAQDRKVSNTSIQDSSNNLPVPRRRGRPAGSQTTIANGICPAFTPSPILHQNQSRQDSLVHDSSNGSYTEGQTCRGQRRGRGAVGRTNSTPTSQQQATNHPLPIDRSNLPEKSRKSSDLNENILHEPEVDFGWTFIDNTQVPYILRQGQQFSPVKLLEQELLSKFMQQFPDELRQLPTVTSHYMTAAEADVLNRQPPGERHRFTNKDLVVNLFEFRNFYSELKPLCLSRLRTAVDGGWVQVNNSVVPYVVQEKARLVSLNVIRYAAGLLVNVPVPVKYPNDEECNYLNRIAAAAGVEFSFDQSTELVDLNLVLTLSHRQPVIMDLPSNDPFGNARCIVIDDDPAEEVLGKPDNVVQVQPVEVPPLQQPLPMNQNGSLLLGGLRAGLREILGLASRCANTSAGNPSAVIQSEPLVASAGLPSYVGGTMPVVSTFANVQQRGLASTDFAVAQQQLGGQQQFNANNTILSLPSGNPVLLAPPVQDAQSLATFWHSISHPTASQTTCTDGRTLVNITSSCNFCS